MTKPTPTTKPAPRESEDSKPKAQNQISRRALIAGTAALAVASSSGRAFASSSPHHGSHAVRRDDLVRSAGNCGTTGEICQAHCQQMLATGDTRLADCSASVAEMTASCSTLAHFAASNSEYLPAMAKLCIQILKDCKATCEKHPKHEECMACAEACEHCIEECEKVAA
ncbi:MAG: hypothetical protein CL917_08035 [Deltaproteobacteria bacterium]|nr:hypothetical protein [Deltaproteobacteria bacterium]